MRGLTFSECGNVRRGDTFLGCCLVFHEWPKLDVQNPWLLGHWTLQKFCSGMEGVARIWSKRCPSTQVTAFWKEHSEFLNFTLWLCQAQRLLVTLWWICRALFTPNHHWESYPIGFHCISCNREELTTWFALWSARFLCSGTCQVCAKSLPVPTSVFFY